MGAWKRRTGGAWVLESQPAGTAQPAAAYLSTLATYGSDAALAAALRTAALNAAYVGVAEKFSLFAMDTAVSNTNYETFSTATSQWFNTARLSSGAQNDEVVWDLGTTLKGGTWTLVVFHRQSTDGGIYTIDTSVDGSAWSSLTTLDGYVGVAANTRTKTTGLTVPALTRFIRFKMATKNASSTSYIGRLSHITGQRTGA